MATLKKTNAPAKKQPHVANIGSIDSIAKDVLKSFGEQILAPIVGEYLTRLHAAILAAETQGVQALFCYRAGVRIAHLYKSWLEARGEPVPGNVNAFKASRIAALKSSFANAPDLSITGIGMHLSGMDLHDVACSILGTKLRVNDGARLTSMPLHEFIRTDHIVADQIRAYLTDQSDLMAAYLKKLAHGSDRLMLIDSGWAGTSQLVLEHAFRDYSIEGVYFGTVGRASILECKPGRMHGLMFNTDAFEYDDRAPETVMALHRHLFESLFEPALPSITSISKEDLNDTKSFPPPAEIEHPTCAWDEIYRVVLKEIVSQANSGPTARRLAYSRALVELREVLVFPTPELAPIAAGKFRSVDLGREGGVDPLLPPVARFEGDNAGARIQSALWPAGQAALEHTDVELRRKAQLRIFELSRKAVPPTDYFVAMPVALDSDERNDVAIITRTKNRPTLLRRAASSVACQTATDHEWVIVNDGGDLNEVLSVVRESFVDPSRITICHNVVSLGMEGASNAGIANSRSEWIVIHDDDDSWHPDFLKSTTSFLDKNRNLYKGVITGTILVSEEIIGETVVEHSRTPYQDWVKSVHLAEMATGNFFAPIAFVFSRAVYNTVGGFDPRLPVLGDWDFNLRFLLEGDIGVIDTPLAYYHHRNVGAASSYSNSVVGGLQKHLAYNSIVRNKYVRAAGSDPKMATLANLVNAGYLHLDTRARVEGVRTVAAHSAQLAETQLNQASTDTRCSSQTMDERWVMMCALATRLLALSKSDGSVDDLMRRLQQGGPRTFGKIDLAVPPDFDEKAYLERYPDIAASVSNGQFKNGYTHFVFHGQHEGRVRPAV